MAIFDFITNLLGGGARGAYGAMERGAEEAAATEQAYLDYLKRQYAPYLGAGRRAVGEYFPAIEEMRVPQTFYEQMMGGYEMSPETRMAIEEGTRAATQAASAAGTLGGGELLKNLQRYGQQLSAADQQRWLENMLRIRGGYTGGLETLMGGGRQALASLAPVGAGITGDIADLITQRAQARGAKQIATYSPYTQWLGRGVSMLTGMGGGGMGAGGQLMGVMPAI